VTDYRPTHLACCWDNDWRPQWRVDLLPSYKAHRVEHDLPRPAEGGAHFQEAVPAPLEAQIPVIEEVLAAFGIAMVGADGHEADDVIGTLATGAGMPVDVVTGDRDLFQLVDDDAAVRVLYTARGVGKHEQVTNAVVQSKYGIDGRQYADFAALRGDPSAGQRPGAGTPQEGQRGRRVSRRGPEGGRSGVRPRPRCGRPDPPADARRARPAGGTQRAVGARRLRHPPRRGADPLIVHQGMHKTCRFAWDGSQGNVQIA
jgi:hypothetical protein